MTLVVFKQHSAKSKHDSVAVDGYCFRYSKPNVKGYAHEYRCCDDKCTARVLFNSQEDFCVVGDHSNCVFDHQREFGSRTRLDIAFNLLERYLTEPQQKIIEMVQAQVELPMTREERKSLRVSLTRKRSEILGRQTTDTNNIIIPDHLRVTATPVSPEHPDNSFLIFDSNEDGDDEASRVLIFASADMRFKASIATELFADGTYRVVPRGFATLYTIHSVIDGVPYPVFFCLTKNEREETFMRVLSVAKLYLTRFDTSCVVHTDCQRRLSTPSDGHLGVVSKFACSTSTRPCGGLCPRSVLPQHTTTPTSRVSTDGSGGSWRFPS